MVRLSHERVLLIGDVQRDVEAAMARAFPTARVVSVASMFDGIAELAAGDFTAVLAAIEPIERRPDAAVRTLRELSGNGKFVLFGHPTLEVLARKMLEFGCDDYIITPANPNELQDLFARASLRITPPGSAEETDAAAQFGDEPPAAAANLLKNLPLADIFLDALVHSPHGGASVAIEKINQHIGPDHELRLAKPGDPPPLANEGRMTLSHSITFENVEVAMVHLLAPGDEDGAAVGEALAHLALLVGKTIGLQDRHNRLQRLAITDELTGLYNKRYFHHFLAKTIERARTMRFPVTLLLFDIDNFKKYNDQFGHAAGDEILRQSARLMRRCCREHDLVARIGGDEFAVVFWDKEGPRQPLDPAQPVGPSRPPQEPMQIFERFRKLAASEDFSGLGSSGRGQLTVSGGLAVYPYDAADMESLFKRADEHLMFRAKREGKNSIYLVNGDEAVAEKE